MMYKVWFSDCAEYEFFDTIKDARHYAKVNEGNIYDIEKGETIEQYEPQHWKGWELKRK